MANRPMDLEIINPLERPLSSDVNLISTYAQLAMRSLIQSMFSIRNNINIPAPGAGFGPDQSLAFPLQGPLGGAGSGSVFGGAFFGSAFKARALLPAPSMTVTLDAGVGLFNNGLTETAIGGVAGLNDISVLKPLVLSSSAPECTTGITPINAADPTNARIDLIEVTLNRTLQDATSRDVLNTTTGQFTPTSVLKTLSYSMDGTFQITSGIGSAAIVYKVGTPAANPQPPIADQGYTAIAYIRVPANATAITNSMISDARPMIWPNGQFNVAANMTASTASGAAPNFTGLSAPPGVQMTALKFLGANGAYQGVTGLSLYVVAGGSSSWIGGGVTGVIPFISGTMSLGSALPIQVVSFSTFPVRNGRTNLQALLADPTQSAVPISVGADQVILEVNMNNGGNGSGSMNPAINLSMMAPV